MIAIRLEKVSKRFRRYSQPRRPTTLKSALVDLIRGRHSIEDGQYLWALKDIDLEVPEGTTLGIIGRNGSGKSTLLKILAGIYSPTSGKVEVNGRVSALIELGAGFHPELSGRENIFINGMILGLSRREIRQKFDEIVAFAELEDFIDAPVRTYSSGMYMRLGFSVAIHVNPEILLIDEIFAVGDENYQSKCLRKLRELKENEKTIFLVSHDLNAVEQMCDTVCLLDCGFCVIGGKPTDVIAAYHRLLHGEKRKSNSAGTEPAETGIPIQSTLNRWGTKEAEITNVSFFNENGAMCEIFKTNEKFLARIEFVAHKKIERPVFGIAIHREDGAHISGPNTKVNNYEIPSIKGKGAIEYSAGALPLLPGKYLFTAAIYDHDCLTSYDHWDKCFPFTIVETQAVKERYGVLYLSAKWRLLR